MADKDKAKTAFVTKKDYTASKSCHFGSAMPPQHSKGSSLDVYNGNTVW